MRASRVALMNTVVAPHRPAATSSSPSPKQLAICRQAQGIGASQQQPGEGAAQSQQMDGPQFLAGEEMRAQRHHEGRHVEEQHAVRGIGENHAAVQEHELGGEQRRQQAAQAQHAVAFEQGNAAHPGPQPKQRRRAARAQARLEHRRDAAVGEFDRHLIEAPDGAEQDHQPHRAGIEPVLRFAHRPRTSPLRLRKTTIIRRIIWRGQQTRVRLAQEGGVTTAISGAWQRSID